MLICVKYIKKVYFQCFLNKILWDSKYVNHSRNNKILAFKFLNIPLKIHRIIHITKVSVPTKLKVQSHPDIVTTLFSAHKSL